MNVYVCGFEWWEGGSVMCVVALFLLICLLALVRLVCYAVLLDVTCKDARYYFCIAGCVYADTVGQSSEGRILMFPSRFSRLRIDRAVALCA